MEKYRRIRITEAELDTNPEIRAAKKADQARKDIQVAGIEKQIAGLKDRMDKQMASLEKKKATVSGEITPAIMGESEELNEAKKSKAAERREAVKTASIVSSAKGQLKGALRSEREKLSSISDHLEDNPRDSGVKSALAKTREKMKQLSANYKKIEEIGKKNSQKLKSVLLKDDVQVDQSQANARARFFMGKAGEILNYLVNGELALISPQLKSLAKKLKQDMGVRDIVSKIKAQLEAESPNWELLSVLKYKITSRLDMLERLEAGKAQEKD